MALVQKRVRMPSATAIVARSYPDQIIGIDNKLPWHLSSDLKMFKRLTTGHAIIMGRKTLESIGRPLPNRYNIVLSRSKPEAMKGVIWTSDPETAMFLADVYSIINKNNKFFVIGGEQIYSIFGKYINSVYLTEVFCGNINGDAKFEIDFDEKDKSSSRIWYAAYENEHPRSENDEYPFRVTLFRKRKQHHRYRLKEEFLRNEPSITRFVEQYELMLDQDGSEAENRLVSKQLSLL